MGLGIGCWQGHSTGPAVRENCLHVHILVYEATERPEDEGDSSWTGCMLGWASILISHKTEQDGALWECFVFCLCAQPGVLRYQVRLCACGEHGLSLTTGRTWANGSSTSLGLLVLATTDRYSLY